MRFFLQSAQLSKQIVNATLLANGLVFTVVVVVFGDMLRDGCYVNRANSLYWFLGSFLAALLGLFLAAHVRTEHPSKGAHRLCSVAVVMVGAAILLFAVGGVAFLHSFIHNEIVVCPDDSGSYDNQSTGA